MTFGVVLHESVSESLNVPHLRPAVGNIFHNRIRAYSMHYWHVVRVKNRCFESIVSKKDALSAFHDDDVRSRALTIARLPRKRDYVVCTMENIRN